MAGSPPARVDEFGDVRCVRKASASGIVGPKDRAYFVDGLNIALIENLIAVVRQLGLPEHEARDVLASRRFQAAVDADWQRCRNLGITAVPTFVVGNDAVVGAQPYEVLESLVVKGGAAKRSVIRDSGDK